jgi:NAD(P)-dependent dehydrogenase (short-subunit alcohol dehydrogenase family)
MINAIYERYGKLDAARSNTGIVEGIPFLDSPVENWHRIMDIGHTGCYHSIERKRHNSNITFP